MSRQYASRFARLPLLGLVLLALGCTAAARAQTVLTLGTATAGGGFMVYGEALAAAVAETDPGLVIELRRTAGSMENIPLLESKELDVALVQGEAAHEALNGIGRPRAQLPIIAAMYPTPGLFIVRADSPYRTITELRGQPVAFGARGSGFVILARYLLDGLGLDMENDFQAVYLERAGDGPVLLREGRVAALWGGGSGWPGFLEVLRSPAGGRFITPTADEIQRVRSRHRFLKPLAVPAGSYPGQDAALESVGSWSFILARPALPDDIAYRFTRALHLGEAALASRLPQGRDTTAGNTVSAAPDLKLLHPGTRRYLQEIGAIP